MKLSLPACVELTGVKRKTFDLPLTSLADGVGVPATDAAEFTKWIVFFRIEEKFAFARLSLPRIDERAGRVLKVDNQAKDQALKIWPKEQRDEEAITQSTESWYAVCEPDANTEKKRTLGIVVTVDTRHPGFVDLCEQRDGSQVVIPIPVTLAGIKSGSTQYQITTYPVEIELHLPVARIAPYDGIVGIDFGNTNTTVVAVGMASGESPLLIPSEQRIVDGKVSDRRAILKEAKPVATLLEMLRFSADNGSGVVIYEVNYGEEVVRSTKERPLRAIHGAKRWLSDRPSNTGNAEITLPVGEEMKNVQAHIPAELFVTKMLEAFMCHTEKSPEKLAITCPSTFSETEVERLKATVINARDRALQCEPQQDPWATGRNVLGSSSANIVRNCLDEATAAAFFFASREATEAPGGLPAFRYLYPNGKNILVYDCGGGTTDITLARFSVAGETTLKVDVLGRVGHRTFGGDFVTHQYFRILKVLVCGEVAEKYLRDVDGSIAEVFDRIDKGDLLKESCNTRYDPKGPHANDAVQGLLTRALWYLAEQLKCLAIWCGNDADNELDTDPGATKKRLDSKVTELVGEFLEDEINGSEKVWQHLKIDSTSQLALAKLKKQIMSTTAPLQWLEELVDKPLQATIQCANNLIESKLVETGAEIGHSALRDVHAVYLVGNSSKFPLIRRRVLDQERGLRVRFVDERIRDMRSGLAEQDLKGCVAKGVVIATRSSDLGCSVEWDKDVMGQLPYDVDYGEHRPRTTLFAQGEKRTELKPARIQVSGEGGRRLNLLRRWPGESVGEPYISFDFEKTTDKAARKGTYVIEYDVRKRQYMAYREDNPKVMALGVPQVSYPIVSPVQSGEI